MESRDNNYFVANLKATVNRLNWAKNLKISNSHLN